MKEVDPDGSVTLTCECPGCGHKETFPDEETPYNLGWDGVGLVSSWPVSCPLCPGVGALGLVDHSPAHEKWREHGRPEAFTSDGIVELEPQGEEREQIREKLQALFSKEG